ncbi:hypothetical protein SMACR_03325 [Sordaria macrospora]|uniref:WGS project CABT00000000 data, contig 2.10 n=2 Tax=Sordaria macrospora TaxID=5147 RepID=F7VWK1_SORMK|nr:uncharacterized protein SMAC_03325 [Sordaria macrospora k-hell]KAA8635612.1 hypothetical protein SMACR_03325 [Sordaria macrospora]WPJ66716.1 hypothetical protein SMAC4_03325 [Sordaria macrospora]CCC09769.1 unnamed protein product [Sordaria macrospora k-hell]
MGLSRPPNGEDATVSPFAPGPISNEMDAFDNKQMSHLQTSGEGNVEWMKGLDLTRLTPDQLAVLVAVGNLHLTSFAHHKSLSQQLQDIKSAVEVSKKGSGESFSQKIVCRYQSWLQSCYADPLRSPWNPTFEQAYAAKGTGIRSKNDTRPSQVQEAQLQNPRVQQYQDQQLQAQQLLPQQTQAKTIDIRAIEAEIHKIQALQARLIQSKALQDQQFSATQHQVQHLPAQQLQTRQLQTHALQDQQLSAIQHRVQNPTAQQLSAKRPKQHPPRRPESQPVANVYQPMPLPQGLNREGSNFEEHGRTQDDFQEPPRSVPASSDWQNAFGLVNQGTAHEASIGGTPPGMWPEAPPTKREAPTTLNGGYLYETLTPCRKKGRLEEVKEGF